MKIDYPETKEIPFKDTTLGFVIEDLYRWPENINNEEVKEWIKKQNEFSRKIFDSLPKRREIEKEYLKF